MRINSPQATPARQVLVKFLRIRSPPQTCGAVVGAAYAVYKSMSDPQARRLCHPPD